MRVGYPQSCPPHRIKPNQNHQLLDKALFLYAALNTTSVMGLRGEMVAYLREREEQGATGSDRWGEGKVRFGISSLSTRERELTPRPARAHAQGLVFTAGNADTFTRVLTTLRLLHSAHLASPLPAEVFSFPGEEPDEETRGELEMLGARLRVVDEARRGKGRR